MKHHGGSLETKRNAQMLEALRRYAPVSSLYLQQITGGVAVGSTIADLRKCGVNIPPAKYVGKTKDGNKIYLYDIIQKGGEI